MHNDKAKVEPEEQTIFRKDMDRRSFLKVSGATAGAVAVAQSTGSVVLRNLTVQQEEAVPAAAEGETLVPTFCRPNCFNGCRVYAHVRDGKVVKTSMAPFPDSSYNRICLRGLTQPQQMYSERRIKYPMKRAGERGEGKWERISWDEAIETVVERLQEVREKYGNKAVAFTQGSGNFGVLSGTMFGIYHRLFSTLEATNINSTLDVAQSYGVSKVFGGGAGNDQSDIANAKTLFIIGSNMTEAQIHTWHFAADAIEKGAKVIVVDPNFTATASKAHQWVQIRPGSDGALFLAMMNVILAEGLEDKEYVHDHTVAPFLVRADNGLFLRESHVTGKEPEKTVDAATGKETIAPDPYMVWSEEAKKAVVVGEGVTAAVTGSFTVNGIKVNTALDLLKQAVAEWTPEHASKVTTIPAETIRELAIRYATHKPSTLYHCMGIDHWDNAHETTFAEASLAAITGNVGKPGASVGFKWYYIDNLNVMGYCYPDGKFSRNIYTDDVFESARTGQIMGQPDVIKAMFVACCNPLGAYCDRNTWVNTVLPSIDFIVAADIFDSDTVEYADIVLPVAHWFESTDMHFGQTHPYVMYGGPAVPPSFESRTDHEIVQLLAERMGVSQYFPSEDELLEIAVSPTFAERTGFTLEQLKKDGTFKLWYQDPEKPNIGIGFNGIFPTPSKRAEFYKEAPVPRVKSTTSLKFDPETQRLPRFAPPLEAWSESEAAKKYPLAFFQEHTRWRVHTQFADVAYLRELDPEPTVKMNPENAAERGIVSGDYVEIFNDRGHVVVKAVISNAIRKDMLSLPKGWLTKQHKAGSPCELTHMNLNAASINQSYFDVAVDVRKWNEEA